MIAVRCREEPPCPSWRSLIAAGCAAARPNSQAFLRGVWQALEVRAGEQGQLRLPLGETLDDHRERRELVKELLAANP